MRLDLVGRCVEVLNEVKYILAGGAVRKPHLDKVETKLLAMQAEITKFEAAPLMRVAIVEGRDGTRFLEIFQNLDNKNFRIKFMDDGDSDIEFPFERLTQLRSVLDDVIWQKGRYTHIPNKGS